MLDFLGTARVKLLKSTAEPRRGGFSPWGSVCPLCPLVLASPLGFGEARKEERGDTRWTGRTRCPFAPRQHGVTQTESGAKVRALLPAWLPTPASPDFGGKGVFPRGRTGLSVSEHPGCRCIAPHPWGRPGRPSGKGRMRFSPGRFLAFPFLPCLLWRAKRSRIPSGSEAAWAEREAGFGSQPLLLPPPLGTGLAWWEHHNPGSSAPGRGQGEGKRAQQAVGQILF